MNKPNHRYFLFSILFIIFLGWMLNCTGFDSSNIKQQVIPVNVGDIQHSNWVRTSQWINTKIFGLSARSIEFQDQLLNTNNLEKYQLYVYTNIDGEIHALPFTQKTKKGEQRFDYTVLPNNTLKLVVIALDGSVALPHNQSCQFVLIPNDLIHKLTIDMNNYELVSNVLALAE